MPHIKRLEFWTIRRLFRQTTMPLREIPSALRNLAIRDVRSRMIVLGRNGQRYASGDAAAPLELSEDFKELDSQSSFISNGPPDEKIKAFDPVKRASGRRRELPPSRWVTIAFFRSKLIVSSDINIDRRDIIEDLFIHINLPQNLILPQENTSLGLSRIPVLNRHINR